MKHADLEGSTGLIFGSALDASYFGPGLMELFVVDDQSLTISRLIGG
jgi:hypothetical protein